MPISDRLHVLQSPPRQFKRYSGIMRTRQDESVTAHNRDGYTAQLTTELSFNARTNNSLHFDLTWQFARKVF